MGSPVEGEGRDPLHKKEPALIIIHELWTDMFTLGKALGDSGWVQTWSHAEITSDQMYSHYKCLSPLVQVKGQMSTSVHCDIVHCWPYQVHCCSTSAWRWLIAVTLDK